MSKLLIVDDHPLYREGVISALTRHIPGAQVLGAPAVREGLAVLNAHPGIDLVLIDVHLPGLDGFAALDIYGREHPSTARVLVSGQSLDALELQSVMRAGASGFIPKTLTLRRMVEAIATILDGGIFVPSPSDYAPPMSTKGDLDTTPALAGSTTSANLERVTQTMSLRQLEVLALLGEGRSNKDIARHLDIAERTVKAHATRVFELLDVANRTQAILVAQKLGLLATA